MTYRKIVQITGGFKTIMQQNEGACEKQGLSEVLSFLISLSYSTTGFGTMASDASWDAQDYTLPGNGLRIQALPFLWRVSRKQD